MILVGCMMKHNWKGMIDFKTKLYIEYAFAYSKDQARVVMARRIAKKQGVLPWVVLQYLKEHTDKYEITLEQEFAEVNDEE